VAELDKARFGARYLIAGMGNVRGWEMHGETSSYAVQGPGDTNRYVDGVQVGGLGYAVTPTATNGITEIGGGIPGVSPPAEQAERLGADSSSDTARLSKARILMNIR
jgi:hypothetical protein